MKDLNKLKVQELLELCKEKNIIIKKKLKKKEIIDLYLNSQKSVIFNLDEQTDKEVDEVVNKLVNELVDEQVNEQEDKQNDEVVDKQDDEQVNKLVDEEVDKEVDEIVDKQGDEQVNKLVDEEVDEVVDKQDDEEVEEQLDNNNLTLEMLNETVLKLKKKVEELEIKLFENNFDNVIIDKEKNLDVENNEDEIDFKNIMGDFPVKFQDENINLLNQLYSIGIRFNKILDTNCYDNKLLEYISERGYDIKGLILDKFYNENEQVKETDINLTEIKNSEYDMVLCNNLFQLLSDDDIKLYYTNILRASSNLIIIKVENSELYPDRKLEKYTELFNEVVNNQTLFKIDRFITNNLAQNIFILRKTIFSEKS